MTIRSILIVLALVFTGACGDDPASQPQDAPPLIDAGAPDASCFTEPQTYNEIINACTTAVKVFKDSRPPLLRPDGTLPELPP
jgi:hypothetical protein